MKKLRKMSLIVLVPIALGLLLFIIGGLTDNSELSIIGTMIYIIGMPVTMFLLVVVGLILMITGRLNLNDDKYEERKTSSISSSQKEEDEKIEDINSSYGYQSNRKYDKYLAGHISNNYKHSTFKQKILGWLFFLFLMTDFSFIIIFGFLKIEIGTYICFALFGGTILISVVVKKIIEKRSIKGSEKGLENYQKLVGKVKACLYSSSTSTGGSQRRHTTRIIGVTYKVIIEAEDKQYTAYSNVFFKEGDMVNIATDGKNRTIILNTLSTQDYE